MADSWNTRSLVPKLAGRRALLMLDYDGTLREATPDPSKAHLTRERRELLRRLAVLPLRLALISGRSVADLKRQVGVDNLVYCGDFGLEMEDAGWRFVHPQAAAFQDQILRLRRHLVRDLRGLPDVFLQKKAWGFSLHYRGLPRSRHPEFHRRVDRAREASPPGVRWVPGDLAWEVLPDVSWDKGNAARLLWHRFGAPYVVAVGDGASDEAMFRAVAGRGDAVQVGNSRTTAARYRLKDVPEVYRFLKRLEAAARSGLKAP